FVCFEFEADFRNAEVKADGLHFLGGFLDGGFFRDGAEGRTRLRDSLCGAKQPQARQRVDLEQFGGADVALKENDGALHRVLEFADVSYPARGEEMFLCLTGNARELLS